MEAFYIIDAMVYDSRLAEKAMIVRYFEDVQTVKEFVQMQFGDYQVGEGEVTDGAFLAVYADDGNDIYPFQVEHEPEIVLTDIVDNKIWLWKIE